MQLVMGKIVVQFILAALIISCTSIEENRNECPCWYTVDFSRVNPQIPALYLWFFDEEGRLLCRDTLSAFEYGQLYEVELKRGSVEFYVWGNVSENTEMEHLSSGSARLLKRDSIDADPLFRYGKILDTGGENGCDTVYLAKEHADMEVVLKGGAVAGVQVFEMILDCGTCGLSVDGSLVEGQSCIISLAGIEKENYAAEFRILRQSSLDGLKMSLRYTGEDDGYIIEDFPIGRYLEKGGYDMDSKNLKDVRVELDLSVGEFIIDTENWRVVMPVDVKL